MLRQGTGGEKRGRGQSGERGAERAGADLTVGGPLRPSFGVMDTPLCHRISYLNVADSERRTYLTKGGLTLGM